VVVLDSQKKIQHLTVIRSLELTEQLTESCLEKTKSKQVSRVYSATQVLSPHDNLRKQWLINAHHYAAIHHDTFFNLVVVGCFQIVTT